MAQDSQGLEIQDRFYGKECIRIAEVVRNGKKLKNSFTARDLIEFRVKGKFHTIKQYEIELKMSLAGVKEYMSGKVDHLFPKISSCVIDDIRLHFQSRQLRNRVC